MDVWGDTYPFISRAELCKTGAQGVGCVGRHAATADVHGEAVVELHLASGHCVIPTIVVAYAVIPELNYCR